MKTARTLIIASVLSGVACVAPHAHAPAPSARSSVAAAEFAEEEIFAHQERVVPYATWAAQRRERGTRLRPLRANEENAPRSLDAPPGATRVSYASQGRTLGGWANIPAPSRSPHSGPAPGVLYLHHAFSLTPEAWQNAKPFLDAGCAVFLPALRGENGNPGERELLFGEVDDARAAVAWLAAQPGVDARRIFVIGHSIGGAIASLLALDPPPGVLATASVGGIYRAQTFHFWADDPESEAQIRFDTNDAFEVTSRLFLAHVRRRRSSTRACRPRG